MAEQQTPGSENPQPATLAQLVTALPRKIFTREAVLWVLTLVLGGVAAAQGMDHLDGGVDKRLEPFVAEQKRQAGELAAVKDDVAAARKSAANAERIALETNLNVRLIAERMNLRPITIEPTDGGR